MSQPRKHQKASDVWAQSVPINGTRGKLREVFPEIASARVEVRECNAHDWPADFENVRPIVSTEDTIGEFHNCTNRLCYNGGVSIGRIIRRMVQDRETRKTVTEQCQGYRGSPKGRKNYGPCFHEFQVTVEIIYKDDGKLPS